MSFESSIIFVYRSISCLLTKKSFAIKDFSNRVRLIKSNARGSESISLLSSLIGRPLASSFCSYCDLFYRALGVLRKHLARFVAALRSDLRVHQIGVRPLGEAAVAERRSRTSCGGEWFKPRFTFRFCRCGAATFCE